MDIKGIKPMIPTHSSLLITAKPNTHNFTNLSYRGNIKQITDDLHFIMTMNIDIEMANNNQLGILNTVHQFEVVLNEHNIKFTTEKDYWDMASLIQIAITQTRIFLMQELQKLQLPVILIPIDPLQRIYQLIKEGNYLLWN